MNNFQLLKATMIIAGNNRTRRPYNGAMNYRAVRDKMGIHESRPVYMNNNAEKFISFEHNWM
jgi:hypothetical protein